MKQKIFPNQNFLKKGLVYYWLIVNEKAALEKNSSFRVDWGFYESIKSDNLFTPDHHSYLKVFGRWKYLKKRIIKIFESN